MFLLRRAAARGLQSKTLTFQSSRSFVSSPTFIPWTAPQLKQTWSQRRLYSEETDKKNESPAEQQSGETLTKEPSEETQKQEIVEESVATPDVADAAAPSSGSTTQEVFNPEPGDAAPEPETVPSSATQTASSTLESAKEKVSNVAEATSQAASSFASRAGATGRRTMGSRPGAEDPQPSKILYIGNLYFDLTADQLRAAFEQHGSVVNCKIVTDSSGLSKGFGYVEFEELEQATRAIEQLDQTELEGRRMAVQYHVRRMRTTERSRPSNPPSKTLFVGNMSFQMSDKDLNDLFRQVKGVLDVRVAIDRRSGQPRGFAHADFTDVASAEKGKKFLENKVVYGRQLRVDYGISSSGNPRQR